jgi:hypothetical protein
VDFVDRGSMTTRSSTLFLGLALMLTTTGCFGPKWGSASADPSVLTIGPATFHPNSGVTEAVRDKCKVDRDLAKAIAQRSPIPVALTEDPSGGAQVLRLEITSVFAPSGGRYSGPKQLVVHGEVVSGEQVLASFDDRRSTTRSTGTCKMLDNVTTAISKDVKKWLKKSPSTGAQLGELR